MTVGAASCDRPAVADPWGRGDLTAAAGVQRALLPPSPYTRGPWSAAHRYSPAGCVGGDIVDLFPWGDTLYFLLADVSGKGVAAAMLTAYVHAVFRALIPFGLPIEEIVRRASALLCKSTLQARYVTIVFGSLAAGGDVVVANAGHPPPFVVGGQRQPALVPTGTAAGLFCDSQFGTTSLRMHAGETLFLYSDGVTEAFAANHQEYGVARLQRAAARAADADAAQLIARVSADHERFLAGAAPGDDVTMLAIRRLALPRVTGN